MLRENWSGSRPDSENACCADAKPGIDFASESETASDSGDSPGGESEGKSSDPCAGLDERGWLDVVFASDGNQEQDHAAYVKEHGLEAFPYVMSQPLGLTFQVAKLPYAALVDERGTLVAKGIVNSREHVESLFEARRLAAPDIDHYLKSVRESANGSARQ